MAVKKIGVECAGLDFIYEFLYAFGIPKATVSRLQQVHKPEENTFFYISKLLFCGFTTKTNLYSELNLLKREGLERIRARFILLVNEDQVLAYDKETEDTLSSSKKELYHFFDFFFPLIGIEKSYLECNKSADLKAAEKFAQLYNQLIIENKNRKDSFIAINNLFVRLLFCFFADSVGLIPRGTIYKLFSSFSNDSGEDIGPLIQDMFNKMSAKNRKRVPEYLAELPIIDNDLFNRYIDVPCFNRQTRRLLVELSGLDWSAVNPDILGSLIQSIVFPDSAGNVSTHFTSIPNINKLIRPLFLDELYDIFERSKKNRKNLLDLLKRLSEIRVFDPSCGTGNFLIVTYKELRLLESSIIESITKLPGEKTPFRSLSISQFYGIESNELACQIAKLGLFFTECQLYLSDRAKLSKYLLDDLNLENIVLGNATRMDWRKICPKNGHETYIIGNPPYKGARKQSQDQKLDIKFVFGKYDKIRDLDYASCWFYLASSYIEGSRDAFAFVTTNSLTQGQQVGLLWTKLFEKNVHIAFAHTAFKWKSSAKNNPGVTVVIIGVRSNIISSKKFLFTQTSALEVLSIDPYLRSTGGVIVTSRREPISNLPHMPKGNMPYDDGNLLLAPNERVALIDAYPASKKFLKRVMGSEEFIWGIERWCIWIKDDDLEEALSIPAIKQRILRVKKFRLSCTDLGANRLAERPHQFRETNVTTTRSLIIPSVSSELREYIPIGFVYNDTIITNLAFAVYDCEPWLFGVISSKMHNVWIRAVCGGLETRIRYSSNLGYNNFPFPEISKEQKNLITELVKDVISEREKEPEKTMAQLYSPGGMSQGLHAAHKILDDAVERCYRVDPFLSDQERLEFLFKCYKELISNEHS